MADALDIRALRTSTWAVSWTRAPGSPPPTSSSPRAKPPSSRSSVSTSTGGGPRATTEDFVTAIRQTRPTLTKEMIEAFERDTEAFARY